MSEQDDFDFNFTELDVFETKVEVVKIDICGLVKKMQSKERHLFNIGKEVRQISALIENPPAKKECFKFLSVGGGFSSLAFIKYIAELEGIEQLYCSTFRIGKNHFNELCKLKEKNKIGKACFITSQTQERTDEQMSYKGKEYRYYDFIVEKCREYGWTIKAFDNHSKLILMKTPRNYYVIETSSNLNENPKMEQFNFENDKQLFEWYEELFKRLSEVE